MVFNYHKTQKLQLPEHAKRKSDLASIKMPSTTTDSGWCSSGAESLANEAWPPQPIQRSQKALCHHSRQPGSDGLTSSLCSASFKLYNLGQFTEPEFWFLVKCL